MMSDFDKLKVVFTDVEFKQACPSLWQANPVETERREATYFKLVYSKYNPQRTLGSDSIFFPSTPNANKSSIGWH